MKTLITATLLVLFIQTAAAQTGTYRLSDKNGASCTIAINRHNTQITGDVFAWWHTASGRHGAFTGEGIIKNNSCTLKSQDDADCGVALTFTPGKLHATFNNCITSNLPDDFSGTYQKITDRIPGDYKVTAVKAYFYKTTNNKTLLKTYLIKGNKVTVDLENITDGQWVYINYTNAAGKTTSGYIQWSALIR